MGTLHRDERIDSLPRQFKIIGFSISEYDSELINLIADQLRHRGIRANRAEVLKLALRSFDVDQEGLEELYQELRSEKRQSVKKQKPGKAKTEVSSSVVEDEAPEEAFEETAPAFEAPGPGAD